jgi:putative CocE/NonD family hydrolase
MGENRWRGYDTWPVPGAQEECWYLASNGHANTRGGDGTLARTAPSGDATDTYLYDPADPVPTRGGATLLPSTLTRGPVDQGPNEERPDVLCYTSAPFEQPCTAIGAVGVTLFASSSAPDTDFVARLVDVYPDGRAIGVADGIIRASARESYPAPGVVAVVPPTPIEPERVYEYSIDLWATAITFLPGHRLRVEITSSSFPRWDRNLNTGKDGVDSAEIAVARQHIFHDPAHPSRLTLWRVE